MGAPQLRDSSWPSHAWLFAALGAAAVALGVAAALGRAWVCDDAFISFRYAQNLVRGHGLVFNPGERVEGFSNPLWTLLMAAGLRLGRDVEAWAIGWGLAFHAGTLALLALAQWRLRLAAPEWALPLPAAALVAAAHPDFAVHATSGLETSSYTFLVLAGFFALTVPARPRVALAGALYALAALSRPDGVLFAALGACYVAMRGPRRARAVVVFSAAFLLLWGPATALRVAYYGSYFPNTAFAKSAELTWYSQGFLYVRLYFERYWALLGGLAAGLFAVAFGRREASRLADPGRTRVLGAGSLALAMAGAYLFYLIRVGGDFMYARMIIPVTPLLLVVGELGLGVLVRGRAPRIALALVAVLGTALTPAPVTGLKWVSGIADEWDHYANVYRGWAAQGRRDGATLHRYFSGLPIGMVFMGTEARLVYYADPEVAVEGETGLTDAFVAHQPLPARGRVGHEKHAPADYVLSTRRLLLSFSLAAGSKLGLDERIPFVPIAFDRVQARLLRWDPQLLEALAARGARFLDVPAAVDAYLARADSLPTPVVRADYARLRTFYFDHVTDPVRERAFERRLLPRAEAQPPESAVSASGPGATSSSR